MKSSHVTALCLLINCLLLEAQVLQVPDDSQHPEIASSNSSAYIDPVLQNADKELETKNPIKETAAVEETSQEIGEACQESAPSHDHKNDIIQGELDVDDGNLSSGIVYALSDGPSSEKNSNIIPLEENDEGEEDEEDEEEELPTENETEDNAVVDKITTDSVSVPNTINATANDSSSGEEDIPSFSEWRQKVLDQEEQSGANSTATGPSPTKPIGTTIIRQKNYASPDCGAKILAANAEARLTSSVLEPSRDEYLLSACSSKIWFIIELCEAIQAKKVEIANFELFSSSPKDFRVSISDRFPTRDWMLLGDFVAADERTIQSFLLDEPIFGKFVKVEVMSHYGTEHYCPISLFRVYGNNEYEVLDIEDSETDEEYSTDEDPLESKTNSREEEGGNIIHSVIKIIQQTVDYGLGKSHAGEVKDTNHTIPSYQNDSDGRKSQCFTLAEQLDITADVNESLSCQWSQLNSLVELPWLHSSVIGQCQEDSLSSFYSPELELARAVWGSSIVRALCYWPRHQVLSTVETPTPISWPEERTETIFGPLLKAELEQLEKLLQTAPAAPELNEIIDATSVLNPEVTVSEPVATFDGKPEDLVHSKLPVIQPVPLSNGVQHKESVFVRLTNRIKSLERNMSLSGQYLEELSRRYKRQVDDMQKTLNRTMQTLNETLRRITTQEEHFQVTLVNLQGQINELNLSTHSLNEENLTLRTQVVERHLLLMMMEVVVFLTVMWILRRVGRAPRSPPPSPSLPPPTSRPNLALEYRLEVGQKVEEMSVLHIKDSLHKTSSVVPSLADSTSSGCESAFSVPTTSRSTSVEKEQPFAKFAIKGGKKKKKKKNSAGLSVLSAYHTKDSKSTPSSPKIRLKSDNWEWHSRAKILAAEFIKESCEMNEMRSSM